MADRASSVLARLKAKPKESGRSFQLCLQLFAQEEFVRRIEKSKYADNFILKCGLLIYAISGFESRSTVDIDFLLKNISNGIDNVQSIINLELHLVLMLELVTS